MRAKLHTYSILLVLGFYGLTCATLPIHAQEAQETQNPIRHPLADLYACQDILPVIDKSACYDQASKALQAAERRGQIMTLNATAIREIQEGVFGYKHLPILSSELPLLEQGDTPSTFTLQTITVPVEKVERYLSGYVITLDNNQVWEQFAGSISRVPKGKLSAEINTTATGTYKMALFNAKTRVSNIRVRRIR